MGEKQKNQGSRDNVPEEAPNSFGDSKRFVDMVKDIGIMFDYATGAGLQIEQSLRQQIALLYTQFQSRDERETAVAGEHAVGSENKEKVHAHSDGGESNEIELILKVHGGLSALIAPATPISLKATRPIGLGLLIENRVMNWLIYATLLSLAGFIGLSALSLQDQSDGVSEGEAAVSEQVTESPAEADNAQSPLPDSDAGPEDINE